MNVTPSPKLRQLSFLSDNKLFGVVPYSAKTLNFLKPFWHYWRHADLLEHCLTSISPN